MDCLASLIEHVATFRGRTTEEEARALHCTIGDEVYRRVTEHIRTQWETRMERDRVHYVDLIERWTEQGNLESARINRILAENLERSNNIDYGPDIKRQGERAVNAGLGISLTETACTIGDDHVLAYPEIVRLAKNAPAPVTWLRFDRHADWDTAERTTDGANYVTHVARKIPELIREIITLTPDYIFTLPGKDCSPDERFTGQHSAQICEGVRIATGPLFNFRAQLSGPVILDIDIDGTERQWKEGTERGATGGRCWNSSTSSGVHHYNQQDILLHPYTAALGLRQRLANAPLAVLIHTERSFRNSYFHHQIEYDFLRGLAANSSSDLP